MKKKIPVGYRKDGTPIWDILTWAKLFEDYPDYRRVAETVLEDGTRISTVWLGLDHDFGFPYDKVANPRPVIFETMVFDPEISYTERIEADAERGLPAREPRPYHEDWDQERYVTEAEAIIGHDLLVRKWKAIREAWKQSGAVPEDAPDKYRPERTKPN